MNAPVATQKHILIRTDANDTVFSGHLMRCLAIAEEARRQAIRCTFVIADRQSMQLIEHHEFPFVLLKSAWDHFDSEIPQLLYLLREQQPDAVIVDSYYVTEKYLSALCEKARLLYIDDRNAFCYPCHYLLNYNISAEDMGYEKNYHTANTRLLLGPAYAPLRSEYHHVSLPPVKEQVTDILLTTGAGDPLNVMGLLLQYIFAENLLPGIQFHVAVGSFNSHLTSLKKIQALCGNIILHTGNKVMSQLMCQCDIAVSAGGSTLYELCACGLPTVVFCYADNQQPAVEKFGESLMRNAGDACSKLSETIASIVCHIKALCLDAAERRAMAENMIALVDGDGPSRIIRELMNPG